MERVSIVIPIYNAEKYLELCLDSILGQTYQELEVILVNDGSSDGSGLICDDYAKMDQRITVYHRSNAGVSSSRNFGMEHAKGKYILFVDADDTLEADMIKGCVALANKNKADLVICSFRYHLIDDKQVINNSLGLDFCASRKELFSDWLTVLIDKEILNPPWNKFVRRDLLEHNHIRFHEEFSICEDMAFSIQLIAASKKTVLTGKMYYNYYVKTVGTLVFKFHENYFEALTYFYLSAYDYCMKFKHNKRQLSCLNTLYVNRIITFIKQICTKSKWDKKTRYDAMMKIGCNEYFLLARKNAYLNRNKKLLCFLLQHRLFGFIHILYKLKTIRA